MNRLSVPFLALSVIILCAACDGRDGPTSTTLRATPVAAVATEVAGEGNETRAASAAVGTEVAGEAVAAELGTSEADESSPVTVTAPGMSDPTGEVDVTFEGWVAGDYYENDRVVGKWVRVESAIGGEIHYPSLPDYDCWGGCYVPVVARTCPLPQAGTLLMARVAGQSIDHGFGVDVCVPGGSMVPTGRTAEGDPSDLVHFLATYSERDLYNRESTILATVVNVFSGSPDYFSDTVRLRESLSSMWAPTGKSSEEGMSLEVFAWYEDPVAPGRPFAVFDAAFIIWDR